MKATRNEVYAHPTGGQPLLFDLFVPEHVVEPPLVIFLHGGGWISGDKSMYHDEVAVWVRAGLACACVSYRLAPLHIFPAPIADLQDAVMFFRREQHALGLSNKIAAMGNSAGGHLALMLALCDTYMGDGAVTESFKVNAATCICPITDVRNPRETHDPIAWSFLEQFLGTLNDEDRNNLASPITHVSPGDAPCLLIHGDVDDVVPVQQSISMAQALSQFGVEHELLVLENEYHSFSYNGWHTIRERSQAFMLKHLGAGIQSVDTSPR